MITVVCIILVAIGAINWFSVGVFDYNIVDAIFKGDAYIGAQIIYGIIGIAGLYLLVYLIYNRFSGVRIHAPECMWRKKLMHKMDADDKKGDTSEITEVENKEHKI